MPRRRLPPTPKKTEDVFDSSDSYKNYPSARILPRVPNQAISMYQIQDENLLTDGFYDDEAIDYPAEYYANPPMYYTREDDYYNFHGEYQHRPTRDTEIYYAKPEQVGFGK